MKVQIEGETKEIAELFQAIRSSQEQEIKDWKSLKNKMESKIHQKTVDQSQQPLNL